MQIISLKIEKPMSYSPDAGKAFVGEVQMAGENGSLSVKLSSKTISAIFKILSDEAQAIARENAKLTARGIEEAIHGPLLADHSVE